jgi:anti-sigma factor RsiW
MKSCSSIRDRFSEYLDGALTGVAMQQVAAHLERCTGCAEDFAGWRQMQETLAEVGPAKAPPDLALRLRVAISQEQARTPSESLARFEVKWKNTFAPFLLRATAGFASAVLLLGTTALLIGAFASPEPVEARDEPSDAATSPRFLYSLPESNSLDNAADLQDVNRGGANRGERERRSRADARTAVFTTDNSANPIVVEAYVNSEGRAYDYRIISGPDDAQARARVETLLLFSVFAPARVFGEPVHGVAVMTLSGISVQG